MLRYLNGLFAACVLVALAACGGGGDTPTGDVYVTLSYSPPSGTVGQSYRYTPAYTSSQALSEHFEVSGGALPPGLGISAGNGEISGIPLTPGTYYFTVRLTAKNVDGGITRSSSITIASDLVLSLSYNPPAGTVGQPYSYTPTYSISKAGLSPSFTANSLPPGLSIDSSTGALSGTPTSAGTFYSTYIYMSVPGATQIWRSPIFTIAAASASSSSSSSSSSSGSSSGSSSSSSSSGGSSSSSAGGGSSSSSSSSGSSSSSSGGSSSSSSSGGGSSSSSSSGGSTSTGTAACTAGGAAPASSMADGASIAVTLNHAATVYDKGRNVYYATIPATDATQGNRIATISANTGAISYSSVIGSDPSAMAISADCSTLYVGLNGSKELARIALPSMTLDGRVSLGSNYAESISVSPASRDSVAVSLANTLYSPRHEGVSLYKNLVKQALSTQAHTGSNKIAFDGSGDWVFGINTETSEAGLRKIAVSASGLTQGTVLNGAANSQINVVDSILMTGRSGYSVPGMSLLGTAALGYSCTKLPGVAKALCIGGSPYGTTNSLVLTDTTAFTTLSQPAIPSGYYYEIVPGAYGQVGLRSGTGLLIYQSNNLK